MHLCVSALQDEGLPSAWNDARLWLEDWLNKALAGEDFGAPDADIMILMICTDSLPRRPAASRLTRNPDGRQVLALHIEGEPQLVQRTSDREQIPLLCSTIARQIPTRPLRKPSALEYGRLRAFLRARVEPLAHSSA